MTYWFRPKRWGKWPASPKTASRGGVAVYVPTSWPGWIATAIIVVFAGVMFRIVDLQSHSVSDTLIGFAPWALLFLFAFDALCFKFGEYPSWWGRRHRASGIASTILIAYILIYIFFRSSHTEIWRHDYYSYVIFPNKAVYYLYRPIEYFDSFFTGMRFHIEPHAQN